MKKIHSLNIKDTVVISKTSQYYNTSSSNPGNDVVGILTEIRDSDFCYRVMWENGTENSYQLGDLIPFSQTKKQFQINLKKIYILEDDLKPKSINDIFLKLYKDNSATCTYWKCEKTNKIFPQCSNNRIRSIHDFYRICKTYLPNITLKEVFFYLIKQMKNKNLKISYCSDIKRNVLYFGKNYNQIRDGYDNIQYYPLTKKLLNLYNIKNYENFKKI